MTGLVHITRAMQDLGLLESGGTPSTSEQAAYLIELNAMLGEWQSMGLNGSVEVIGQRTITKSVSTAGVWTRTDTGATSTITPTAIATYANPATDNTYPVGWDDAIRYNLATRISGSQGVPNDILQRVVGMAEQKLSAITPKDSGATATADEPKKAA